ncbi:nucleoid-associated protein [Vibrio harveyi]|uniref:nucleoid-associated protein n=1 Tax=Vibrio harveyi TaxID=669 RepID=UPI00237EF765|nr:nucleoid-associated protein [Vibrio harveyi]HDM8071207.1 nucleoid-associated protein [Vibrio harveyi]HDZ5418857.1 nucleoid-associated protein [Vibrio harveyi]
MQLVIRVELEGKMAVLTPNVIESLQIENFIYHVIRHDLEEPSFNDEVTLEQEQKEFFERQIRRACEGTQFLFSNPDDNTCRIDCLDILEDVTTLVPKSRLLTQRFFSAHNRTMSDGIFIVAVVSVLIGDTRYKLLSFLKIDFTTVYQQKRNEVDGRHVVSLTRIIDSLADTPRALQKWAILDPEAEFSWDVIALQRGKTEKVKDTNEAISDYFRNFLQVIVRDNPSSLTKKTVKSTSDWSREIAGSLPPHVKHTDIKARSVSYFDSHEQFDTDSYVNHVLSTFIPPELKEEDLSPEEHQRKQGYLHQQAECKESLREMLTVKEISGQIFECRPNSIPTANRKSKLVTGEDVSIFFKGELNDNNITITEDNGEKVITIRTTQFEMM